MCVLNFTVNVDLRIKSNQTIGVKSKRHFMM